MDEPRGCIFWQFIAKKYISVSKVQAFACALRHSKITGGYFGDN